MRCSTRCNRPVSPVLVGKVPGIPYHIGHKPLETFVVVMNCLVRLLHHQRTAAFDGNLSTVWVRSRSLWKQKTLAPWR
jgi:hypothetical protein